jgi:transcriptional regulator with XRE-family HTH domain
VVTSKTVGERLQQARVARGLSQHALALRVGFKHQSAISNLESRATGHGGRRLPQIADVLSVPLEWVLQGPDCENDAIPWKLPPEQPDTGVQIVAAEPAGHWETPLVREAMDLLKKMSSAGQQEALRYLRYLAKQHAFPPSAIHDGKDHPVSSISKAG